MIDFIDVFSVPQAKCPTIFRGVPHYSWSVPLSQEEVSQMGQHMSPLLSQMGQYGIIGNIVVDIWERWKMNYDREAIFLDREEGLSLRDIAKKHGIGKSTVKRILDAGEKKEEDISTSQCVDVLYACATSPEGVLGSEEIEILNKYLSVWNVETRKAIRRKCRIRAAREGKTCLFVPDWIGRNTPRYNRDVMMEMANSLFERIQEYVQEYRKETGYSNEQDIHYVLCQLAVNGFSPASITSLCDRWDAVVRSLEKSE